MLTKIFVIQQKTRRKEKICPNIYSFMILIMTEKWCQNENCNDTERQPKKKTLNICSRMQRLEKDSISYGVP